MKYITTLFALFLLMSCADQNKSVEELIATQNVAELRASRTQLTEEKLEIEKQIELLDDAISNLGERGALALVSVFEMKNQAFEHFIELQGSVQTKQNLLVYPEIGIGCNKRDIDPAVSPWYFSFEVGTETGFWYNYFSYVIWAS